MVSCCNDCGNDESFAVENGFNWCMRCGNQIEKQVVYVHGYANPQHYALKTFYSRSKRFKVFLGVFPKLREHCDTILDVFSIIEFVWGTRKKDRIYFFSKNVCLHWILRFLGIVCKVPLLKDESRNEKQFASINKLWNGEGQRFFIK